ncbi:phosphotriesterase [Streptomyces sp. NBC_01795]|uniref:phosphotriesterase family protein n=1 Tax=unclassified Streptomyces TaxID=2593676 RepID=UPI002DD9314E|nr:MULTISPECIES: phosphotriesterase [unclassified Streptomyces]WSA92063.1 phosphotriesterase [Streptomyces sp. NBC_01795]WSS15296.1 phosphotriesterase [Streptomyces sp. NBC_01186]
MSEGGTPAGRVRTVRRDISGPELGVCDAHDHLFLRSPRLPGQELADTDEAERQLRGFAEHGGEALVQWTPYGMGRRAGALVELARRTGVHVIAATGLHQAVHYPEGPPADPAALFVEELTRGVRGAVCGEGPRAGLIKVAGDFHGLGAHACRAMSAAAEAHHATGAPIAVHLELGTGATEVLDLLCSRHEVPPGSVLLRHPGRCPDLRMQREAARAGAWLVFDGPSRTHHATDWRLLDSFAELAERGHAGQLLVGGDTVSSAARAETGAPYVTRVLRPRLARELGEDLARRIFVANPARAFAADWKD